MAFFHGVIVTEVSLGGLVIQVVNSAVIGLVGTAPQWYNGSTTKPGINVPTLVTTQQQGAQFGPLLGGYTIPYALNAIQQQGAAAVIVVDVFNPATMATAQAITPFTGPASNSQPISLGHMGLSGPGLGGAGNPYALTSTVVVKNSGQTTTYVENTDYTVDYNNGLLYTKAGGAITASQALQISFSYMNPTLALPSNIVGTVASSVYTGLQALLTTFSAMGVSAKILITPNYYDSVTVAGLAAVANQLHAMYFIDRAPVTTPAAAITARGTVSDVWDRADYRCVLCFPGLLVTDTGLVPTGVTVSPQGTLVLKYNNVTVDQTASQWFAGTTAAKDLAQGFWWSPSNTQINGILGPDVSMYMNPLDANSDTNLLNAAGIVTIFNGYGTGLRMWGNRSSAFPANTDPTVFICIRRTLDVLEQSIQVGSLPFIDNPITTGLINSVLLAVNGFIRTLIQQGALLPGSKVSYNPGDNSQTALSNGQVTFAVSVMPPPPAEQITYNVSVNTSLLANLTPNVSGAASNSQILPTA
jgi:phage tail sheath protein FI